MADRAELAKIPVQKRWKDPKWSVRQSAYLDIVDKIKTGEVRPSLDELKACSTDANVIALEAGIAVIQLSLETLADSLNASQLVQYRQAVLKPLAEKGLVAAKPSVKKPAAEAILTLVEVADPPGVVEELIALISASKSPKSTAAFIQVLDEIYKQFGSPVSSPEPVLKALPPFFGHVDRNVRQAASDLSVTMCRWVGMDAMLKVLAKIKPVQLNELTPKFEAVDYESTPSRFTRSQQEELAREQENVMEDDVEDQDQASDADQPVQNQPNFDPWTIETPVDVTTKIPSNFHTDIKSTKWKERSEVLNELVQSLTDTVRVKPVPELGTLIGELLHVAAKDANQACYAAAIEGLRALASGLRKDFNPYAQRTFESLIDRLKDKKQTVIGAINSCYDAVLENVLQFQINTVLDTVLDIGMAHKTPAIRVESCNYLSHALSITTVMPKPEEIQRILPVAVKLLNDTSEPMRSSAAKVLATLTKLAGESTISGSLDGLDEHKKKRIDGWLETVTVVAKAKSVAKPAPKAAAKPVAKPAPKATLKSAPALAPSGGRPRPGVRPMRQTANNATTPTPSTTRSTTSKLTSPTRGSADVSMDFASPSVRIQQEARQKSDKPAMNSTPKMVKRSVHNAGITPARDINFRRRMQSPTRYGEGAENVFDDNSQMEVVAQAEEIAKLTALCESERAQRLQVEKRLAAVQVEKDRTIALLREEVQMLRIHIKTQKNEFDRYMEVAESHNSFSSNEDINSKLSGLAIDPSHQSRPASQFKRPNSQILPVGSTSNSADSEDQLMKSRDAAWDHAVNMTNSLKQRLEALKQQRNRSSPPQNSSQSRS